MNNRAVFVTTALATVVYAGLTQANDTTSSNAVTYDYGVPLHVAKVVSLSEPMTLTCKVITSEMKYIDTSGNPAAMTYRKLSEACNMQG
ncbi:DUF2790 domain-containing protein [Pseudomonas sp. GL-R-19]|uniref:DUF2790 domain-containing protein n=1 Tax=Pseudomonas sp. GL-R-19 TaxID=2832391 RepID=UPI001CC09EB4|nr:DUF2790 domain-containing protein [Pseudomonas sp. GL-R-19]